METISSEIVEKTWREMSSTPPEDFPEIIEQITKEQPIVLAYLLGVGGDTLNQDERELLLYLGIVIWQIMLQAESSLPQVTEEIMDNAETLNMEMLEYLEGEAENDFINTVVMISNNYQQPEVLKYIVEALMEETNEDCVITNENKGIMMIYLKSVIDCFNN